MPASQPQAITEVAKPVAGDRGVARPHGFAAVMIEPRGPHAEGLGERVVDGHAVDLHHARRRHAWVIDAPRARPSSTHLVGGDPEVARIDMVW